MPNFMVVCTFKPGTAQETIAALIPEERIAAAALQAKGLVGAINLARSRDTVFIEVNAADQAAQISRTRPVSARGLRARPSP